MNENVKMNRKIITTSTVDINLSDEEKQTLELICKMGGRGIIENIASIVMKAKNIKRDKELTEGFQVEKLGSGYSVRVKGSSDELEKCYISLTEALLKTDVIDAYKFLRIAIAALQDSGVEIDFSQLLAHEDSILS